MIYSQNEFAFVTDPTDNGGLRQLEYWTITQRRGRCYYYPRKSLGEFETN